uniref:GOLD domain-containing protein n=1 Tax=Macrostomum lignano TaxID=282301 RepID=A0A1I8FKE7_9PLAT
RANHVLQHTAGLHTVFLADCRRNVCFKWRFESDLAAGSAQGLRASPACNCSVSMATAASEGCTCRIALPMVFLVLKIFNCIAIHLDQGFTEFINKRKAVVERQ